MQFFEDLYANAFSPKALLRHLSMDVSGPQLRGEPTNAFPARKAELAEIFCRNQKESPFLCLPGEIRNMIYDHALCGQEIHAVSGLREQSCLRGFKLIFRGRTEGQTGQDLKPISQVLALDLHRVSRQIYLEIGGRQLIFKNNSFSSHILTYLNLFLCGLAPLPKSSIEVIRLDWQIASDAWMGHNINRKLSQPEGFLALSGLKSLVLHGAGKALGQPEEKAAIVSRLRSLFQKPELEIVFEN